MIRRNKTLKILGMLIIFATIINMIPYITKAADIQYKQWSTLNQGDTIYFDTTGLDWENVYIYIWQQSTNTPYKDWYNADAMTKVTDNIYSYTVPAEMESGKYNMLIFKNGIDGSANQTIDLGFVESKFAYRVDSMSNGNRLGYWYLYDKSSILNHIENAKVYQNDKQYYTEASYSNLDELILQAATETEEIRLLCDDGVNYYIKVDITLNAIDTIISNLEIDKSILSNKVEQESNNPTDNYTPNSVQGLTDKLEEAKELLLKDNITIDELKKAIADIDTAKANLVEKADKTELAQVLDSIKDIDKNKYTDETVQSLEEIVKQAENILQDDNATQEVVDNIVQELKGKIANLEEKKASDNTENNTDVTGEDNTDENKNTNTDMNEDANTTENTESNTNGETAVEGANQTQPEGTTGNAVDQAIPKTGDNIMIYVILLVFATLGLLVTFKINKKKSSNNK